jgi:hypothetical protein
MKTALKIFGIVVLTVILLGCGYFLGSSQSLFKNIWVGSAVTDNTTKAAILSMRLNQIEENRMDDLKSGINIELDGCVLILVELIDWDDPTEADIVAIRTLAGIAKQRSASGQTIEIPQAETMINEGLKKAQEFQNNQ